MSGIDAHVLYALYAIRDPFLTQLFLLITEFGEARVILFLTIGLAVYLFMRRRAAELLGILMTVGGAGVVVYALKEIVARERPEAIYNAVAETTSSFPSWHAGLALAFYGYCIYLLWPYTRAHRSAGVAIGLLNVLIVLVVFSRLYLGVHYVSDVLVGALIGAVFLAAGILVSGRFKRPQAAS